MLPVTIPDPDDIEEDFDPMPVLGERPDRSAADWRRIMLYIVYDLIDDPPEVFFCGPDKSLANEIAIRESYAVKCTLGEFIRHNSTTIVCQVIEAILDVKGENLIDIREQIQENLLCLLDDQPQQTKDLACQIVVDAFKEL